MATHTGELSDSPYNLLSGRVLGLARKRTRQTQDQFSRKIRSKLGIKPAQRQAWGHLETGRAEVPAAVLLASLDLAHVDWSSAAELFRQAANDLKAGDAERLRRLRQEIRDLRKEKGHDPGLQRRPAEGRRAASK